MKSILYSVYYNDSEGLKIYNIIKSAEFNEQGEAFKVKELLNEQLKENGEEVASGLKCFYGITQKSGKWQEQQQALKQAAENCGGVYAIR